MPAVKQKGFTLIELIVVIVITGIIAIASTQFIVNTVKGFSATSLRDKRANTLRITLAKIEHQLNNSIKSSVRVIKTKRSQCLEMLPIQASAFYVNTLVNNSSTQIQAIGLTTDVTNTSAIISSPNPAASKEALYRSAMNNQVDTQKKIPQSPVTQVGLTNPITLQNAANTSLVHFVSPAISYCLEKDQLYRYTSYSMKEKQQHSTSLPRKEPHKVLLNQNLLPSASFNLDEKLQLLKISLTSNVDLADSQEEVTLYQQWWLTDE